MLQLFALPAILFALAPFQSSIEPLPKDVRTQLKERGFWHKGCPVGLADLRLLTVSYRDFDRRAQTGQLVVNKSAARPLRGVFRKLYRSASRIRHWFSRMSRQRPSARLMASVCSGLVECRDRRLRARAPRGSSSLDELAS